MAKQEEKMIPVTIYLTPKQIREAYHQLVEGEEEDWINAPEKTSTTDWNGVSNRYWNTQEVSHDSKR